MQQYPKYAKICTIKLYIRTEVNLIRTLNFVSISYLKAKINMHFHINPMSSNSS
ncbi:hypothetical protein C0J52_19554 [Blattella germanica]|nr:hypothetical protein C0J52_19554 [Blattella germanica]